jgi:hypothetical protein
MMVEDGRMGPEFSGHRQCSEVGVTQPGVTHDAPLRPRFEVVVAMDRDRSPAAKLAVPIDMMAPGNAGQPPAS